MLYCIILNSSGTYQVWDLVHNTVCNKSLFMHQVRGHSNIILHTSEKGWWSWSLHVGGGSLALYVILHFCWRKKKYSLI